MLSILILASGAPAREIDRYVEMTRATPRCEARGDSDEIIICGRRDADRYRVPLVGIDPGDPAHEGVPAERERLLARTSNCREKSAFLVGCGMAGIVVSSRTGLSLGAERPLAP